MILIMDSSEFLIVTQVRGIHVNAIPLIIAKHCICYKTDGKM